MAEFGLYTDARKDYYDKAELLLSTIVGVLAREMINTSLVNILQAFVEFILQIFVNRLMHFQQLYQNVTF